MAHNSADNSNKFSDAITMEKLILAEWRGLWSRALTADELLAIGRKDFEPLFYAPPFGPVPDHLAPHLSVYGCVAEYEEKIEELDRWKALQLARWLKARLGRSWLAAGESFELHMEKEEPAGSEKFRLTPA